MEIIREDGAELHGYYAMVVRSSSMDDLIEVQATPPAPDSPPRLKMLCSFAFICIFSRFPRLDSRRRMNSRCLRAKPDAVNGMGPQRFDTAVFHRFFPLRPVRKDDITAELVDGDDMAGS